MEEEKKVERPPIAPGPGVIIIGTDGYDVLLEEFVPMRDVRGTAARGNSVLHLALALILERGREGGGHERVHAARPAG